MRHSHGLRATSGAAATPGIVTSGLVLNLDAGNAASYPGSGTTWTDLSGNGNHGTFVNLPTYSSANSGSLDFNGSSHYATIPYNSTFNLSITNHTLEGWAKFDSFATGQILISKDTYGQNFDWCIYVANSTTIQFYTSFAQQFVSATVPTMSTGQWHHIAITSISGVIRIYLNSILYVTATQATTNHSQSYLTLGCAGWNNPNTFTNGNISVLRVYANGLTTAQVLQNYNALLGRYNLVTSGLALNLDAGNVASYPGTGTAWNDISGNGRNFTWPSAPTFTSAGSSSYFSTLGKGTCFGPASNSFGINNTSGYTIFVICREITISNTTAFNFSGTVAYDRGIFSHLTYGGDVYFDQGGCCGGDSRTSVGGGDATTWNIWAFRRLTNSSERSIIKNTTTLITNTTAAADINLNSTQVALSENGWNTQLNSFIVYNRGLTNAEILQNFDVLRGRYGL